MAAALESYVTESVAILLVVAALAVLVSRVARRAGQGRSLGPIELLARLPLEPRRSMYVVRVVDRLLIIGSSEAGLVKLGELPKGALPASGLRPEAGFARLLDGMWGGASSEGRQPHNAPGGGGSVADGNDPERNDPDAITGSGVSGAGSAPPRSEAPS